MNGKSSVTGTTETPPRRQWATFLSGRLAGLLAGVSLMTLATSPALGARTLVIGALDATRNGEGVMTGDYARGMLHAIQGHRWTLGCDAVELRLAPELTPAFLEGLDLLILHNLESVNRPMWLNLTEDEKDALGQAVERGLNAFVFAEAFFGDGVFRESAAALFEFFGLEFDVAPLGKDAGVISPRDPPHPAIDGPFGVVTGHSTKNSGWFTILPEYAVEIAALSANGQPSLAAIEEGALAPGSGRVVLSADGSAWVGCSVEDNAHFFCENKTLFLNIIHWLSSGKPRVHRPEPAARTLTVGAFDATRNGPYRFTGSYLRAMLDSMRSHPAELGFRILALRLAPHLHDAFLDGLDLVFLHNVWDVLRPAPVSLTADERDALRSAVEEGLSAFIATEAVYLELHVEKAAPFFEPFEMVFDAELSSFIEAGSVEPRDPPHDVVDGPFGLVTEHWTKGSGWFPDLGPYATELATLSANGQPSLAAIEKGALAPGSGRVVLSADGNAWADCDDGGHFLFCHNQTLYQNIAYWLTSGDPRFIRGDCNEDGKVDISDSICILSWLFLGGPAPRSGCLAVANANGDENDARIDLSDAVYLLNYLFLGGPAPTAPFPDCGLATLPSDQGTCETASASCQP